MKFLISALRILVLFGLMGCFSCEEYFNVQPLKNSPTPSSIVSTHNLPVADGTFTIGIEDWRVVDNGKDSIPDYVLVDGNPTGHLHMTDRGTRDQAWYFRAPQRVINQLKGSYGRRLSFDFKESLKGTFEQSAFVVIQNGTQLLKIAMPYPPNTDWTHYEFTLDESQPWKNSKNGKASQAEIQQILSKADNLKIRGDILSGADQGYLDNVFIK